MPEKKRRRNGIMPVREYVRFHANQIPDHPLRRKSSRINFGLHALDCNPSSPILPRFGHIRRGTRLNIADWNYEPPWEARGDSSARKDLDDDSGLRYGGLSGPSCPRRIFPAGQRRRGLARDRGTVAVPDRDPDRAVDPGDDGDGTSHLTSGIAVPILHHRHTGVPIVLAKRHR